jgi:hypothetical protein
MNAVSNMDDMKIRLNTCRKCKHYSNKVDGSSRIWRLLPTSHILGQRRSALFMSQIRTCYYDNEIQDRHCLGVGELALAIIEMSLKLRSVLRLLLFNDTIINLFVWQ